MGAMMTRSSIDPVNSQRKTHCSPSISPDHVPQLPVPDVISLIVISDLVQSGIVIRAAQIVNQTLGKLCPCRKLVKSAFRRLFYRSDYFPSNDSYYINTVDQIIICLSLTFYSLNYRVRNAQF